MLLTTAFCFRLFITVGEESGHILSLAIDKACHFFFLSLDGFKRETLPILCSIIALIYTFLYENTITSELICPTPPQILNDYVSVIEEGYDVLVAM